MVAPERTRPSDLIAIALLVVALVVGSLYALPSYGLAWDEALGDLFFGHRNVDTAHRAPERYDRPLLDTDGDGRRHPALYRSPLRTRPWEHWPVMASLSAQVCNLTARRLGWLDAVDAHHLAGVLALALLVPLAWVSARRAWGVWGAIAACLTLLTHPRLLAAAWTDLKDIGTASFVTLALLFTFRGLTRSESPPILAAALAAGLAFGTKANVLFLPVPLLVFVIIARPSLPRPGPRVWGALLLGPAVAAAVQVIAWPWMRADPLARLAQNLGYVLERGSTGGSQLPNPWPLLTALFSWPAGTLPLVLGGVALGVRSLWRREASLEGLALLATVFPLARLCAPGVVSFDGIRHALELVPPAALLAGVATRALIDRFPARRGLVAAGLALALCEPVAEIAWLHPHEVAHFNVLVGGPAGAARRGFPQVEDYWATGYRRAYRWLNEHAEEGAGVAAGVAEHVMFIEGPMRLRSDLRPVRASSPFRPDPGPEVEQQFRAATRQRPVYLVFVTRKDWYGPIVRAAMARTPCHQESAAGHPMLEIVRFEQVAEISPDREKYP